MGRTPPQIKPTIEMPHKPAADMLSAWQHTAEVWAYVAWAVVFLVLVWIWRLLTK